MGGTPLSQSTAALSAEELLRVIPALPELQLRLGWLDERIQSLGPPSVARPLDQVAHASLTRDDRARETMISLSVYLAQNHGSGLILALRQQAELHGLTHLERLVRRGVDAPEPTSTERPPELGGRELSLGERRSLARRPTRQQLDLLLRDSEPFVIEQLLRGPTITEDHVVSMAARRPGRVAVLETIVRSNRWMVRGRVRRALVLNPVCPHALALPLLATFNREELLVVQSTPTANRVLRTVAFELCERLPPFFAPLLTSIH